MQERNIIRRPDPRPEPPGPLPLPEPPGWPPDPNYRCKVQDPKFESATDISGLA